MAHLQQVEAHAFGPIVGGPPVLPVGAAFRVHVRGKERAVVAVVAAREGVATSGRHEEFGDYRHEREKTR